MLQMRRATTANSYSTAPPPVPSVPPAVPTLESSDPDAATSFKEKSVGDSESNSNSRSSDGIELRHEPPSMTTATRLEYRDGNGRLHEVKVIDTPMD